MKTVFSSFILARLSAVCVAALFTCTAPLRAADTDEVCPSRAAVLPAGSQQEPRPAELRQRFEIRECESGEIQLLAFEAGMAKPAIVIDTAGSWPISITQVTNVLVVEGGTGPTTPVFILHFARGKAHKVFTTTRSHIKISRHSDGEVVHVQVPADRLSSGAVKKKEAYSFPVEHTVP